HKVWNMTAAGDNVTRDGCLFSLQAGKTGAADYTGHITGVYTQVQLDDVNTQNWTDGLGIRGFHCDLNVEGSSSGIVTGIAGLYITANIQDAATVTNFYGVRVGLIQAQGTPHTLVNEYGIYINNIDAGTTLNYALYTNAGLVRFGDNVSTEGVLYLKERANADTDISGYGQIWVDGSVPNELWFTDDAGNDYQLGLAAAASTWLSLTDTDPVSYAGEAGNCVVVNAGEDGLEFGAAPGGGGGGFTSKCSVYQSSSQTINNTTFTKVLFQTENYDIDAEFDNSTNHRFVATSAGYYSIKASVGLASILDGKYVFCAIYKNNSALVYGQQITGANGDFRIHVSTDAYLAANDYIEVFTYHNNGGGRATIATIDTTYLTIHRFA
ncbi:MAG: hypothetical protein WAV05_04940, partial [Anaerolineales bacterium]